MSVARRRERYLSQYLSDTTNERANERTDERTRENEKERANARRKKEERKSKQASEKKPACMQAKNHKEKKEIAKKFLTLLYAHVLVQLSRHRRYIHGGVTEHILVQLIGLSFFHSFSILQGDLDSFVRHFSPFYDHFLCMC